MVGFVVESKSYWCGFFSYDLNYIDS